MKARLRRGSTLVAALLVSLVLLVASLGFLGQRAAQNRAVNASILRVQARAMAESGLEDAIQKLSKDGRFPPLFADKQTRFTYLETVTNGSGAIVGDFTVTVDVTHRGAPYSILKLTSTGRVGPVPTTPQAEMQLTAELDVSPFVRGTTNVNPRFFRVLYERAGKQF